MRERIQKQFKQIFFGLLSLLAVHNVVADSPGITAYKEQQYQQAFQLLTTEAKGGNIEAQYLLGTLYLDGLGVGRSPQNGMRWLKQAADGGHPGAARMLGKIYMSGMDVPMDVDKGIYYMQLADQFTPKEQQEECD